MVRKQPFPHHWVLSSASIQRIFHSLCHPCSGTIFQGRHPFVYALAEFIDNALRATRGNKDKVRNIVVTLATSNSKREGLICVEDNGCGMTKQELNDWAVMNYSLQERGLQVKEPENNKRSKGLGAGRFLTGNLSYFGVGSKNAAFFMGSFIKIVTKKSDERYVHELSLCAADLEERYRNHQAVYEEDMVHRNPGDNTTLSEIEVPFSITRKWVDAELMDKASSFTRVIVGNVKSDIIDLISDDNDGSHVCTELAHLYHYYLHGDLGNRLPNTGLGQCDLQASSTENTLPNGERMPRIRLQRFNDALISWERCLDEVDDDPETLRLRLQKAEMEFSLEVPNKGIVFGALYYYPYENDRETVPISSGSAWYNGAMGQSVQTENIMTTQNVCENLLSLPSKTQGRMSSGNPSLQDEECFECENADTMQFKDPIFEAFWQGRLIPGARIDTVPFIEEVRRKRNAKMKDLIPDEVFNRLRGALFFGPSFKVTRNKLLFRDNLETLLLDAVPKDRNIEKNFREWIGNCHSNLDKLVRFENLADSQTLATVRGQHGERNTAFFRVQVGNMTISAGEIVRISWQKSSIIGRVVYFSINQVVREEGCYANGRVHVHQLPETVYGGKIPKIFSLRRLEGVIAKPDIEEHCKREESRLPSALRIEPVLYASGEPVQLEAGDSLPETKLTVVNSQGQKIARSFYNGEKQTIRIKQRLWSLPCELNEICGNFPPEDEYLDSLDQCEIECDAAPISKRMSKSRCRKMNENSTQSEAVNEQTPVGNASGINRLLSVDNKAPHKDSAFVFAKISDGLKKAGYYALEYLMLPNITNQKSIRLIVPLEVKSSKPRALKIAGEGVLATNSMDIMLGEELPDFKLFLIDKFSNLISNREFENASIKIYVVEKMEGSDNNNDACKVPKRYRGLGGIGELELDSELNCWKIAKTSIAASSKFYGLQDGLDIFQNKPVDYENHGGQRTASQIGIPSAAACLSFNIKDSLLEEIMPAYVNVTLRPGAPHSLRLLPGNPWEKNSEVSISSGEELEDFDVQAVDIWGNPTAPCERLDFFIICESECLDPASQKFAIDECGVANISGLRAAKYRNGKATLSLRFECEGHGQAASAFERYKAQEVKKLNIDVTPSTDPISIQILFDDEPLPCDQVITEDGIQNTFTLAHVPAGSSLAKRLKLVLLDQLGDTALTSLKGKFSVSWHSGVQKKGWQGDPLPLPVLKVSENIAEKVEHYVRFQGNKGNPILLECFLIVRPLPAAPQKWWLTIFDTTNSQNSEQTGAVQSGKPFVLEAVPQDAFGNNCGLTETGVSFEHIPTPIISLISDNPLEYNPSEWEKEWVTHGETCACQIKLSVSGPPGTFSVQVSDVNPDSNGSTMTSDTLTLDLLPGSPAALSFEGPTLIECGTRAALGTLDITICDASGHLTKAMETFEVSLLSSALSSDGDGRAAKVVCGGGNKMKFLKGNSVVRFKNVNVSAEAPGNYVLRAQSSSRKVSLREGTLNLNMSSQNIVTALRIDVPSEITESCKAGGTLAVLLYVETENGEALPDDTLSEGLILRVTPPGQNRSQSLIYRVPDEEVGCDTCRDPITFSLSDLNIAGIWTVAAEFDEPRGEMRSFLGKKAQVRSSTIKFRVQPGPPVTANIEASKISEVLAVTNSDDVQSRQLITKAAVQLQDEYGNNSTGDALKARFRLLSDSKENYTQAYEVPQLDMDAAEGIMCIDNEGRAFFGNVGIVKGTGKAPDGILACFLECDILGLYMSSSYDYETDAEGWSCVWKRKVMFSDDAGRFAEAEKLSLKRAPLLERIKCLKSKMDEEDNLLKQAMDADAFATKKLDSIISRTSEALPKSLSEAEKQLQTEKDSSDCQGLEARRPKWGSIKHSQTASIDFIIRSGDEGVIGVMAQLVTISDDRLARVASWSTASVLRVVVLKDSDTRKRLMFELKERKYPTPDMVSLNLLNVYRGPRQGQTPGFKSACPLAQELTRSACYGTDKPLPLPLPHQRSKDSQEFNEWPEGCLGHLCNLVRPVSRGHRPSLIYGLLSGCIVFETLAQAETYRQHVTQDLKLQCSSEFISLDGGRINGRGIVFGSRPPPLENLDFLIGGESKIESKTERISALEELVRAFKEKQCTENELRRAEKSFQNLGTRYQTEINELEAKVAHVDACMASLQPERAFNSKRKTRRRLNDDEVIASKENKVDNLETGEEKQTSKRRRLTKARDYKGN